MCLPARAVATILASTVLCAVAQAQTGPTDPEIIAGARTARISLGGKKPEGFLTGTVRVTEDGRVRDVLVTENTSDGLEPCSATIPKPAWRSDRSSTARSLR